MARKQKQIDIEDYPGVRSSRDEGTVDRTSGAETPNPVPIAPPVGYVTQPSLIEQIRSMVRSENLRRVAEEQGAESFEESDDFEVGDDYEDLPKTAYEAHFDPVPEAPSDIGQPLPTGSESPQGPTEGGTSAPSNPPAGQPAASAGSPQPPVAPQPKN